MGRNLLRGKILKAALRSLPLCLLFCVSALGTPAQETAPAGAAPAERAAAASPTDNRGEPESERPLRMNREAAGIAAAAYAEAPSLREPTIIRAPEDNALVAKYLAQYSSPEGRKWLQAVMRRGAPYLPYIRGRIAERGLPPELAYLPVVESAFLPTAVSRSGAVGLWQFMKNSVTPATMKIDDWADERRDFWKSTDGALKKLEENYRYFKDWPLALAAYNAGLGAVSRAMKGAGGADYWELSERGKLKTETRHYVPKFIAISAILSDSRAYGLDLGWPEDPRWTRVPVGKTVDLSLLAEKSGVPLKTLQEGNGELRYGVTPPGSGYFLKVPAAYERAVAETLARKDLQLIRYYFHVVRSGDTLSALSRHYGVSVDMIERSNPGLQARYLKLGAKILVPALKDVGPYQREKAGGASIAFNGTHLVKKGETLWSLALAYDVDPELLAEANGLELSSVLREGRTLKTPITIPEEQQ